MYLEREYASAEFKLSAHNFLRWCLYYNYELSFTYGVSFFVIVSKPILFESNSKPAMLE